MLTPEERISTKIAVRRASQAAGGHKVLAADSRLIIKGAKAADQRVSEYANVTTLPAERIVPLDVAVEFDRTLMGFGLDPINIANAAELLGLRLIAVPGRADGAALRSDFCSFARESGEALAAAGMVAADAGATDRQLALAIREIDEAVNAGLEMREVLKARQRELAGGGE